MLATLAFWFRREDGRIDRRQWWRGMAVLAGAAAAFVGLARIAMAAWLPEDGSGAFATAMLAPLWIVALTLAPLVWLASLYFLCAKRLRDRARAPQAAGWIVAALAAPPVALAIAPSAPEEAFEALRIVIGALSLASLAILLVALFDLGFGRSRAV